MTRRVSWQDYFMGLADAVAVRADCTRRKVGAVVVGQDRQIISTGYNGSPPGKPGCLSDGACPRGRHYQEQVRTGEYQYFAGYRCACGNDWPCDEVVAPGSSYDTGSGSCIAVHAELNALLRAGTRAAGSSLYCTDQPCDGCWRAIESAGISSVHWYGGSWIKSLTEGTNETELRKLVRRLRGL